MGEKESKKLEFTPWVVIALLVLLGAFTLFLFFEIEIHPKRGLFGFIEPSQEAAKLGLLGEGLTVEEEKAIRAFLKFRKIKSELIPSGIPDVYGEELNVSFDKVQESMNIMQVFGPTYGTEEEKIKLEGKDLERYIKIGKQTACEYCCGVEALVDDEGKAACGCAHSIVMRGLAAYLIKNHSDEFTDDEILTEINEWKKTFFPKQTLTAKFDELKKAGDKDIETLLEEFPDFLPQMVGGC